MGLGDLVSEDAQLVDGPVLLQEWPQVFLLEGLGDLPHKQFDGVHFFVQARRLYSSARRELLNDGNRQGVHDGRPGEGGGGRGDGGQEGYVLEYGSTRQHSTNPLGQTHSYLALRRSLSHHLLATSRSGREGGNRERHGSYVGALAGTGAGDFTGTDIAFQSCHKARAS